jgi:hypothetical protein
MYIKKDYGFEDLMDNSWSGAVDTLEQVEASNMEEELMELLEEIFGDSTPTETEVNDYLWFNSDEIFEMLGINTEEDDDDEDDEDEEDS